MSGSALHWCKRHPGAVVVAGWAVLNGLLLVGLTVYGESLLALLLWAGVFVLLMAAAVAVLLSSLRGPKELTHYGVASDNGAAMVTAALGLTVAGLMFVFGVWLLVIAVPLLGVAVAFAVRHHLHGGGSR